MAEPEHRFAIGEVPESFFGAVVKDARFRGQVMAAGSPDELRKVLHDRGIHISDRGLDQIMEMSSYLRDPRMRDENLVNLPPETEAYAG